MRHRKLAYSEARPKLAARVSVFYFLFSVLCFAVAGCGSPGEPTPPHQAVPVAVADLEAHQLGDGVVFAFTMPTKSVDKLNLDSPPAVEFYLVATPTAGKPRQVQPQLLAAVPAATVPDFLNGGRFDYRVVLPPDDFSASNGHSMTFLVRTRAAKRASSDSNTVTVPLFPAPQAIGNLVANVTQDAIELSWSPPDRAINGAPLPAALTFHVYRSELEAPNSAANSAPNSAPAAKAAAAALPSPPRGGPLELRATTPDPHFRDTQFEFGHTYLYVVRSVEQFDSSAVESADSNSFPMTPRDIFPPAPPKNLVAVVVPAAGDAPAHVELSWDVSPEPDLAGYNIYRVEGSSAERSGEKLNRELLLTPAFRDLTAAPGTTYTYRVTAVDRAGNESGSSSSVVVQLTPRPAPPSR